MATDRTILRLGKPDEGRSVSSEEFAEAEFEVPWRYEREDQRLIVMAPAGEGHLFATNPWRDRLILFSYAFPGIIEVVATEAWIRVTDGTDRIADIGVYLATDQPVPRIPDRIPDLIFEIVSPDRISRDRDHFKKRSDYQSLGVKEYVIIDRFQQIVTILTYQVGGYAERILTIDDHYESSLLPGLSIPLSEVF